MADPFSFALATVAQIGISYLFPAEGPRLKDLKISASTYGAAIPWVFGLTRVPGNMIWSRPIRERKKKKGVGKGGSYNQYTYFCTFAMGLCRGPVKTIRRVWADGKLIYDIAAPNNKTSSKYRMRFYMGDESQVPDSALVTDLSDNAPAFRGLAYILFDDLPLADWGNRIPQITAEVLVGSSEPTVLVTPLTEIDGTTDFDPTYAPGEAIFDFDRELGYVRDGTVIRQFSLKTGRAIKDWPSDELGFETAGATVTKLITGGQDGALFVTRTPITGTQPLERLDPFSLQAVASADIVPPAEAVTALNSIAAEYLMTATSDGFASLYNALDLTHLWDIELGGTADIGPVKLCGRDADATGNPTFYAFYKQTGDSSLNIMKVTGAETTGPAISDVFSWTGASLEPIAAIWDSAQAGVVMFWKAGAQAYLSKWSEDTGEEAWRTAIAGCPDVFSNQTRISAQELGWVHDGRFYAINTVTGEMIDKNVDVLIGDYEDPNQQVVDWDDYLERYPDVKAEYYVTGWAVSASPQGYAQWHYYTYGQFEDPPRTITYKASGQGQGYALTGDQAGQNSLYQAWDAQRGILVALQGVEGMVALGDASAGVTVGTIVATLLKEGGLPPAMTDLQALYQMPIRGYGWASGTDIKNILDELRRLFLFDLVERDGVLVAVARQDPEAGLPTPVEVIKQGALGSSGEDAVDFWQMTRLQEADLPAVVSLVYMNVEADFEASMARSARIGNPIPTMFSRQQVAMEINVVMTAQEAKTQTNKILYSQWLERVRYDTRLPWAYLNMDPADVFEVHMDDGRTYTARIHGMEIGADFVSAIESYASDAGAYDVIPGDSDGGSGGGGQEVPQKGLAVPFIMNTPLLRDEDDSGGSTSIYYIGVGNGLPITFQGAALYRSTNNIDYEIIASREQDVEWGSVIGRLPSPPMGPGAMDWKTELVIRPAVSWFDIESVTDEELWNGANPCLVGDEVIQFRDCVQNGDGTWTIWNLLRGRRGTEYACDNHRNGERFVFLSNDTVGYGGETIDSRGQPRFFKAVGVGRTVQEAVTTQIAYEPRDLMPYAPADIRREIATGGDVEVTWQRRTRLGGNWQDGTGEVPLVEAYERYEAYILATPFSGDLSRGAPPATFVRKYEMLATPTFTYTAAEQTADGFDNATEDLHVVIYQLSDAVGRGFPGARTILATDDF